MSNHEEEGTKEVFDADALRIKVEELAARFGRYEDEIRDVGPGVEGEFKNRDGIEVSVTKADHGEAEATIMFPEERKGEFHSRIFNVLFSEKPMDEYDLEPSDAIGFTFGGSMAVDLNSLPPEDIKVIMDDLYPAE